MPLDRTKSPLEANESQGTQHILPIEKQQIQMVNIELKQTVNLNDEKNLSNSVQKFETLIKTIPTEHHDEPLKLSDNIEETLMNTDADGGGLKVDLGFAE